MVGVVYLALSLLRVDIRLVEESHLELQTKNVRHGRVQPGRGGGGAGEEREGQAAEVHIDSGFEGLHGSLLQGNSGVERVVEHIDAVEVRDNESREAPVAAQHVGQQPAVGRTGLSVDSVIGGHYRLCSRTNGFAKRWQERLQQAATSNGGGTAVLSALAGAVGDEVLQGRKHGGRCCLAPASHSSHDGGSQSSGQHGVLAQCLFGSAPAWVASQVHHGAVGDVCSLCPDFAGDSSAGALHQFLGEGGSEAEACGENRSAYGHMAVGRFLSQEGRDAQSRFRQGTTLQGVGFLGSTTGNETVLQGAARPGVGAESAPKRPSLDVFVLPAEHTAQLVSLLLICHARQQVLHANLHW